MSVRTLGRLGIYSALLATVFGGFVFVTSAGIVETISQEGEEIVEEVSLLVGTPYDFTVTLEATDGSLVSIADIFFEDESFAPAGTISAIDCGPDGENILEGESDQEISCEWIPEFDDSRSVNFTAEFDTPGEYVLVVFGTEDTFEETLFERTIIVSEGTPTITANSAITSDEDGNGYIDTITVTFSSALDESSLSTDDVSVAGYTVSGVAREEDTSTLIVTLSEGDSPDTDATPEVTLSSILGENTAEIEETTLTPEDGALPVMVEGVIAEDRNTITITFSEDLNGPSVTIGDFTLSTDDELTTKSELNGVVTLTLASPTVATSIDVTVAENGVRDSAFNWSEEHTITATLPPDEESIAISYVSLSTSATSTDAVTDGDTITLTFALGEVAATSTVSILGNTVPASAVGTTYTATYTVEASTPTGTVTFSISVEDDAENESTATATTDDSSLTIVREEEDDSDTPITYNISLSEGFNLISLPVSPSDTSIESVLAGNSAILRVWTYVDGSWLVYHSNNAALSNLTTMDAGYAYFIETTGSTSLSGSGLVSSTARTLGTGWHLVGYLQPSASETGEVTSDEAFQSIGLAGVAYSDLLTFENGSLVAADTALPGDGFWINIIEEGVTLEVL